MPHYLKHQTTTAENATGGKTVKLMPVEKAIKDGDARTPDDSILNCYIRVCKRPHMTLFDFEFQYPFEFLECFGYDHVGSLYTPLL